MELDVEGAVDVDRALVARALALVAAQLSDERVADLDACRWDHEPPATSTSPSPATGSILTAAPSTVISTSPGEIPNRSPLDAVPAGAHRTVSLLAMIDRHARP